MNRALLAVPLAAVLLLAGCGTSPEGEVRDGVAGLTAAANGFDPTLVTTEADALLQTISRHAGELGARRAAGLTALVQKIKAEAGTAVRPEASPAPAPEQSPVEQPSPESSPSPEPSPSPTEEPEPSPSPSPEPLPTEAPTAAPEPSPSPVVSLSDPSPKTSTAGSPGATRAPASAAPAASRSASA